MSVDSKKRTRLETEAIVVGYAMSRLDNTYLIARGCSTWKSAFEQAANALSEPAASFKNLRDEFDPIHQNPRRGWHQRSLRPNRQRVLDELEDVSDDALLELISRILTQDEESIVDAIDSLAVVTHVAYNVAERLLTGRRAEEYFLENCNEIIGVEPACIRDLRQMACGYDFGQLDEPNRAIEIKGIKQIRGTIQFTDKEWQESKIRREEYWLIVVGNLDSTPKAKVVRDPHRLLDVKCRYQKSITATWHSNISV